MIPEGAIPPDGGWGWMVVISSFFIHVIIDGVTYAFGVLGTELVESLGASRQMVGWILSIMVGLTLGAGPIASALSARYSYRTVTIGGAILGAIGFFASAFVNSGAILIFTIGIVTGFGFGMIYFPAIVCVGIYFERLRSTAIGIAVCGSGVGTFIFSPFIDFLITQYGWRGTMVILSAIVLNCAVCGMLFRPLEVKTKPHEEHGLNTDALVKKYLEIPQDDEVVEKKSNNDVHQNHFTKDVTIDNSNYYRSVPSVYTNSVADNLAHKQLRLRSISVANIATSPQLYIRSIMSLNTNHETNMASSSHPPKGWLGKIMFQCRNIFKLDLIKNISFDLFLISNLLCSIGFNPPFLYVPDRAQQQGYSSQYSSFLVSIIGIGNMSGRFIFGALSDQPWVSKLMLYNSALLIAGAALAFSFISSSYAFLSCYCALFGIFIGTYVTLTSPVLVDLLGLSKLNDSFGITLLLQGIGVIIGPPIAGLIFDLLHSFDLAFVMCGLCVAISGLMLYPVPCVQRWQKGSSGDAEDSEQNLESQ